MIKYDPDLILTFIDSLYKQANNIVTRFIMTGFILGLILCALLSAESWAQSPVMASFISFSGGFIGALIGWNSAKTKAFMIKLEAQKLMVNLKIEENTRKGEF